jgi:hypothetical protein
LKRPVGNSDLIMAARKTDGRHGGAENRFETPAPEGRDEQRRSGAKTRCLKNKQRRAIAR